VFSLAALTSAYLTKAAHINADVQRFHLASCLGLGAREIRSAITARESIPIEDFLPNPRYVATFSDISLNEVSEHHFHFRGLPNEEMSLILCERSVSTYFCGA
jgi:hypothetical protein